VERLARAKHQNCAENQHQNSPDKAKVKRIDASLVDCYLKKNIVEKHREIGQVDK